MLRLFVQRTDNHTLSDLLLNREGTQWVIEVDVPGVSESSFDLNIMRLCRRRLPLR